MLSSTIALVFSALALTASQAVERAGPGVSVPPAIAAGGAELVKTALVRQGPSAGKSHTPANTQTAARDDANTANDSSGGVSTEMVLAALAMMLVVAVRRFRSGPR